MTLRTASVRYSTPSIADAGAGGIAPSLRSAPELKPRPAPVRTTAPTLESLAASSSAARSAASNGALRALSVSGRLSVSVTTPASRRICRAALIRSDKGRDAGQLTRDQQLLDLGRAVRNRDHDRLAQQTLDIELLRQTISAVELNRVPADLHRHLGGEPFRHRRLHLTANPSIDQRKRPEAHETRRVREGRHLGDLGGDQLVTRDRLAELPALL